MNADVDAAREALLARIRRNVEAIESAEWDDDKAYHPEARCQSDLDLVELFRLSALDDDKLILSAIRIRAEARAAALDEARGAVLRVLSGGSQTWAGFPLADAVLAAIDALREGADKV